MTNINVTVASSSTFTVTITRLAAMVISESGDGVPAGTPSAAGILYIDTTNNKIYISVGSTSSADWRKVMST